jgi:hypothetical protein
MTERRTARRYDLSVPVVIRVPIEKETVSRTGMTRNISTRSVYFNNNHLRAGAEPDLTIILPPEVTSGSEVFIRATGTVIRVDKWSGNGDQKVSVAAVFERYEIVRTEATIA